MNRLSEAERALVADIAADAVLGFPKSVRDKLAEERVEQAIREIWAGRRRTRTLALEAVERLLERVDK